MAKGRRKTKGISFVMLGRRLLGSKEWKDLSTAAKLGYIYLKVHFNGSNNGDIQLPYRTLKGINGLSSPGTVAKALKELEGKGWVERTQLGGLRRYKNLYKLTGKYDELVYSAR